MNGAPFVPKDSSIEALTQHASNLARAIQIEPEQASLLVSEIRNALAPAFMTLQHKSLVEVDQTEHEEAKDSLRRVLALMDAFAAKARAGVR